MIDHPHAAPELVVTNFHRRFTGVSSTANAVVAKQLEQFRLRVAGCPLPMAPAPISYRKALKLCRARPTNRPFAIWHVRRNLEMAAAIFARDVLRLPIRIVFTSAAQRLHSAVPRGLIARMDAVIATTAKAAGFVPQVKAIIPHGVDTDRFLPAADRQASWDQLGYGGRYGIGIVGRVRPEKGTDLFVRALIRVLPQRPEFTGVVIGRVMPADQPFADALQAEIASAGLSDRVRFVGEIAAAQMPQRLSGLSLLVAPARYEGYGMTPLEAMASGVAVVASDTGAYREMILPGATGVVVPIEDAEQLEQSILRLTENPDQLHRMGHDARERSLRFSLAEEVERVSRLYDELWNSQ